MQKWQDSFSRQNARNADGPWHCYRILHCREPKRQILSNSFFSCFDGQALAPDAKSDAKAFRAAVPRIPRNEVGTRSLNVSSTDDIRYTRFCSDIPSRTPHLPSERRWRKARFHSSRKTARRREVSNRRRSTLRRSGSAVFP